MTKAKVLIVEDDGIVAMDIQSRLMSLGFNVSGMVSSGKEAVCKAKEMLPDIVLMDIRLKGEMDGIEAAAQIRNQFNIPVVYLTAFAEETVLERVKITEPFGYILKPFETRELHVVIEIALVKHKTEAALQKVHNELEDRVAKRTSELVAANDQLRREIKGRKRAEQNLIQAEKMISLGVLVSGVAHEINNPNNFVMLNTPLLRETWESIVPVLERYYEENCDFSMGGLPYGEMRDEIPKLFSGIEEGSERIQRIVLDLKDYVRQDGSMDQSVNINNVIKRAARLTMDLIKKSTGKFKVEYGNNLPLIKGNRQKLEQVAINLIENACQALPDKEKGIFIKSYFDKEMKSIVVQVQDEGCGIPERILSRIMDPFFTTRRSQGGTGLGLSVSATIIKAHNGRIEIASELAKGTIFKVVMPGGVP